MDTLNKYFTNFKRGIILLIIYISFGTLNKILEQYNHYNRNLFSSIESIVRLCRTFSMLLLIVIVAYFVYKGYMYYSSKFFIETKISLLDAFINGFIDIAFVYDKVKEVKGVQRIDVDLKTKSLLVKTKNVNYSIIVRDYAGKIQGKIDYDNWYIISKKRKEFNQIRYKKKVKIKNPYKENNEIIERLKIKTGLDYENIVIITSIGSVDVQNDRIVHLYELVEIVEQEMKF